MNTRTVGVGLMVSGYLMTHGLYYVNYLRDQLQTSPHVAFDMALHALSPAASVALAANMASPLSWSALCLGAGLFAAGVVWPVVEAVLLFAWNSVCRGPLSIFGYCCNKYSNSSRVTEAICNVKKPTVSGL